MEQSNNIVEWVPTDRQSEFLSLPDEIFEALYGGAVMGGKSECLLLLPIIRKFIEHPRFKGLILRRTFPELEKEIILRSLYWYKLTGATYNSQKHYWTFPSGAVMQFGYCEHDHNVHQYDSAEYSYVAFDELTSFTKWMYTYISFERCRAPGGTRLPAISRSGTNPGNIGHYWVRERFIEPCISGRKILEETVITRGESRIVRRIFIPSKFRDNPHAVTANPNYEANLSMLPEAEREAKLEGNWYTFEGQAFTDFRYWVEGKQINTNEPINARHNIPAFSIPTYWPKILAVDWGYSAMMCAGGYAINPLPNINHPAKIYKYYEYSGKKLKISTWATDLARDFSGTDLTAFVIDPSARQNRGDDFTIQDQVGQHFGRMPDLADNDRISGKALLDEYLRWSPKPAKIIPQEGFNQDLALSIHRKNGPDAYKEYCSLFIPEVPESFLPKIQFFDNCKETLKVIPLCVFKKDTKGGNSEDVQDFDGDDAYDETRYGLKRCQRYLDEGLGLAVKEEKIQKIEDTLEKDKNYFEYHYRMEKLRKEVTMAKAVGGHRRRKVFR